VEWFGLGHALRAIEFIRRRSLEESPTRTLHSLFDCSTNPSLPGIAEAIIRLFFILDVRFLDIKKLAALFSQGELKYKTVLRKVYTVANCLELAGIVTRTFAVSEIKLNVSLQIGTKSEFDVPSILNSQEELRRAALAERRRKEYEQISIRLPSPVMGNKFSDPIAIASVLDVVKA
jgi:hypothetical protein